MQAREERLEGASRQRHVRRRRFRLSEGIEAAFLIHPFGLVGEQHRIPVEGDAQAPVLGIAFAPTAQQPSRRHAPRERFLGVLGIGGKKQVAIERMGVAIGALPAAESGANDAEIVLADGVEDAQARVGGVARQQDHVHARCPCAFVDVEQLAHEDEAVAGREQVAFPRNLVAPVRLKPFAAVDLVAFGKVEQRPRRYGNAQACPGGHRCSGAGVPVACRHTLYATRPDRPCRRLLGRCPPRLAACRAGRPCLVTTSAAQAPLAPTIARPPSWPRNRQG